MKRRILGFIWFIAGAILLLFLAIVALLSPTIAFKAFANAIAKNSEKAKLISLLYELKQ